MSTRAVIGNIKERLIKASLSLNNVIVIFMVFKIMQIGLSYASLLIARNFTSQIYMDKVLVNDENPPHLNNFVYLYTIITFVMSIIAVLLIYSLSATFGLDMGNVITSYILPDLMVNTGLNIFIGLIISSKMYDKKYFLYKDDGLRAIRALTEIMMSISFVFGMIPFNYVFKGIIYDINTAL